MYESLLSELERISKEAGAIILEIYNNGFRVHHKADQSPVTEADLAADHFIQAALKKLTPEIPILSEESAPESFEVRSSWSRYWLVDPLDGTKSFVNKTGEFTVNIALIENHQPVLGVVFLPVNGVCYFAAKGEGAYKRGADNQAVPIKARSLAKPPVIAGSRSHSDDMDFFLENVGEHELVLAHSSIKICWVAEGEVDLYARLWPTAEWDTAAAHAIVNESGGQLLKTDMQPLLYNTKQSLENPYFFVMGSHQEDWSMYLGDG